MGPRSCTAPPPDPPPATLPPPRCRRRRRSTAPCWPVLLFLLSNLAAALAHGQGHGQGHGYGMACDLDACTRAYDESLERRGLSGPEGSAAFCGVLYDFGTCMYSIRRACRGNIRYHTSNSMLIHLKTRYNCARRLQQETGSPTGTPLRKQHRPLLPPTSTPSSWAAAADASTTMPPTGGGAASPECSYRGARAFRHCGLFGDPHLRTFTGAMQTCRVQGAWPLVDNRYLAVQVTNEPVLDNSNATATTKVTVLVKGSATPCTNQKTKTYEATADAALPDAFIDGTNTSGPGEAVTVRYQETPLFGASVAIHIRYIETTVIVRKVGRYLAFSTRMPEELMTGAQEGQGDGVQLCVQGCPHSERMNLDKDRGSVLTWMDALEKCVSKRGPAAAPASASSSSASSAASDSAETLGDLTDQYLDWCVFDLMTTGREDFALAAHAALRDTLAMDPSAAGTLRNRTTAQDVGASGGDPGAASASTTGAASAPASATALLAVMALLALLPVR